MPNLTYKHDWKKIKENAISKHQKSTGMGSVKDAVQKIFSENQLEDPYKKYEEMKKNEVAETKLHASRGVRLQEQMRNVLEIDVGGSGYKQPKANHAGFGGKNYIRKDDVKVGFEEIKNNKKLRVHWWNRVKWLQKLPKFMRPRTKQAIIQHNQIVDEYGATIMGYKKGKGQLSKAEYLFQKKYGKNATAEGLKGKKYIYVKESEPYYTGNGAAAYRTRYSMPGPLGKIMGMAEGASNSGDYSIENLSNYMLAAGKDYLTKIFKEWDGIESDAKAVMNGNADPGMSMKERMAKADEIRDKIKPIAIMLKGHSRGGVAISHGAMKIKDWVHKEYERYEKYIDFELIQMDPVPGYGSDHGAKRNINLVEETRPEIQKEMQKKKMMSLGASANTTVIYSLHTNHPYFFSPQIVDGAKRIILTATKHSVNLSTIDKTQADDVHPERIKAHRKGYMDLENGEVYRNSGLSELPEGIYIADENNRLIKIPNMEIGRKIIGEVLQKAKGQEGRHQRIDEVMDKWFAAHSKEKTASSEKKARERINANELETSEKKEQGNQRHTYSTERTQPSQDSSLSQEPEKKRSASIGR